MSGFDVVVLGSLHLDVMVEGPALPRLGETVAGRAWAFKCGGKGGNQAVEAARQGARTAMVGRVGRDAFGERLLANLAARGVDASGVAVDDGAGSGMSVAIVEASGDYGAVIVSGVNLRLDAGDAAAAAKALRPRGMLVLQNEVAEAANLAAAEAVRAAGGTVILNAAPARPLPGALLAATSILVVNALEAEALGTGPVRDLAEAEAAARSLGTPDRVALVTCGGAGLALSGSGLTLALPGHAVAVAGTHGAGDAFVGALAASLASGADMAAACAWANATAASVVATPEEERAALPPSAALPLLDNPASAAQLEQAYSEMNKSSRDIREASRAAVRPDA